MQKTFKIGVICGGPSQERGISLNSARSVLDHLSSENVQIVPFYLDYRKNPYSVSVSQLYSNTPSDFDFKLSETARPLTMSSFVKMLKKVDIVFPVIHGTYGEDGGLQKFLEENQIPFIGSSSEVCKKVFDKYNANELIREEGFFAPQSAVLKIYHSDHDKVIRDFFKENKIKRAIIKPANGGSSIGVFSVNSPVEALEKAGLLFSKRMDTRVVLEPFAEGIEFTSVIFESKFGLPVCVLPTEIETNYSDNQIFDYRKKYLPTRHVKYHCPPRFSNEDIERIQVQAEQLFKLFGMRDFARFDGWIFPSGEIWFSDFNPISGMEQNSFLFQQASRLGMSHRNTLEHIVRTACRRYGIKFPEPVVENSGAKRPVNVLFGGATSERQVSLMSGTNAWLKLRNSRKYRPEPFLLDFKNSVWKLPYFLTLNHTVEEIFESVKTASEDEKRLKFLVEKVRLRLNLSESEATEKLFLPQKMTLEDFIKDSKFVFLGLHGGDGENGVLQKILEEKKTPYNGSGPKVSEICINKHKTSEMIDSLKIQGVSSIPEQSFLISDLQKLTGDSYRKLWRDLRKKLGNKAVIAKPVSDGCSSGVVRLNTADELKKYVELVSSGVGQIPPGTFRDHEGVVELPSSKVSEILLQQFIETDSLRFRANRISYKRRKGWIEVTVGLLARGGEIQVFSPSITVAEGEVLSVEEKFQGGTGVNITPPPKNIITAKVLAKSKEKIKKIATKVGLRGYARIDAFLNASTGDLMIIEINTLPALTPSTVLFQQALAEKPSIPPVTLLEKIIKNADY